MTTQRFNELLEGPLSHPIFKLRLSLALQHVVDATGDAGEKALEDFCRERQSRDEASRSGAWNSPENKGENEHKEEGDVGA